MGIIQKVMNMFRFFNITVGVIGILFCGFLITAVLVSGIPPDTGLLFLIGFFILSGLVIILFGGKK